MGSHFNGQRRTSKSRHKAAVLAIFLGGIGAHKFYLGYKKEGWLTVGAFFLCAVIAGIIGQRGTGLIYLTLALAEVEAIRYLLLDDDEFRSRYIDSKRGWL
jgi:TM2 domain-containing membrane protein YozV